VLALDATAGQCTDGRICGHATAITIGFFKDFGAIVVAVSAGVILVIDTVIKPPLIGDAIAVVIYTVTDLDAWGQGCTVADGSSIGIVWVADANARRCAGTFPRGAHGSLILPFGFFIGFPIAVVVQAVTDLRLGLGGLGVADRTCAVVGALVETRSFTVSYAVYTRAVEAREPFIRLPVTIVIEPIAGLGACHCADAFQIRHATHALHTADAATIFIFITAFFS
tara:strand:+ start:29 stop:703 length:675 start_codon:yes stop_codon:yes gene_type:complete